MSGRPPPHRRSVLGSCLVLAAGAMVKAGVPRTEAAVAADDTPPTRERLVLSTWAFGAAANDVAWARLLQGGHPLDACEAGLRVTEADESVSSVGYGGLPNADGVVELDAAIMRGDTLACGAVAALRNVLHPVSVARAVMEQTPHVLLVGEGALAFARQQGVPEQEMLSPAARQAWEAWRAARRPVVPAQDDHDTLGLIVLDQGRFAMGVTTSGKAFKLPGRVGDSPIIGAGGYCDDEAGACVATGDGEEMIRSAAASSVVAGMRRGAAPEEAVREVLVRLRRRGRGETSVALLAADRQGRVAGCALQAGFEYALTDAEGTRVLPGVVVA